MLVSYKKYKDCDCIKYSNEIQFYICIFTEEAAWRKYFKNTKVKEIVFCFYVVSKVKGKEKVHVEIQR